VSVILFSDHKKILKNQMKRLRLVYGSFMVLVVVLAFGLSPVLSDAPIRDFKMEILESLRDKPLTINQSLDTAEIISNQKAIPIPLLLALISVESEGVFYAHSKKNCKGLLQLSPVVWKAYMGDTVFKNHSHAYDPVLNIQIGTLYLGDLFLQYNDWSKALVHFYCGDGNNQTKDALRYVGKVLTKAKEYKNGG
jgi:hypothetical protein